MYFWMVDLLGYDVQIMTQGSFPNMQYRHIIIHMKRQPNYSASECHDADILTWWWSVFHLHLYDCCDHPSPVKSSIHGKKEYQPHRSLYHFLSITPFKEVCLNSQPGQVFLSKSLLMFCVWSNRLLTSQNYTVLIIWLHC